MKFHLVLIVFLPLLLFGQPGYLEYLGMVSQSTPGVIGLPGPVGIAVSPEGRHVYVAATNYNSVCWFTRDTVNGALSYGGYIQDGQSGANSLAGATAVALSPDGKHVYVIGDDDSAMTWFTRNTSSGGLTYGGEVKQGRNGVMGIWGPNQVAFSPDGRFAYVTASVDHSVSWFSRNTTTGALTYVGILKDGIGMVDGLKGAMHVQLSPDGRHAYVAAYYDSSVAWFSRDSASGTLTYGGVLREDMGGLDGLAHANRLALSPDGKYVYVIGFGNNALSWFRRDSATGALTLTGIVRDNVAGNDGLANARAVICNPQGDQLFVTASGDNSISWFSRDTADGSPYFTGMLKAGSDSIYGLYTPVWLAASPDGRHVYVAGYSYSHVSWFAWHPPVFLTSIQAYARAAGVGVDSGDYVVLKFTSPAGKFSVSAANVNTLFGLSGGHSWLDGFGNLGAAQWNQTGDQLMIVLSGAVSAPTCRVGDSITYEGRTVVLTGSFDSTIAVERRKAASRPLLLTAANPLTPSSRVMVTVPAGITAPATAQLFSLTGQRLARQVFARPGAHRLDWPRQKLPAGVYILALDADGFAVRKKLVLMRRR